MYRHFRLLLLIDWDNRDPAFGIILSIDKTHQELSLDFYFTWSRNETNCFEIWIIVKICSCSFTKEIIWVSGLGISPPYQSWSTLLNLHLHRERSSWYVCRYILPGVWIDCPVTSSICISLQTDTPVEIPSHKLDFKRPSLIDEIITIPSALYLVLIQI